MLKIQGMPANLISMGALDFGLLLEGTLVIVETVYVALEKKSEEYGVERYNKLSKAGIIKKNISRVAPHIFFAQLILIVALFPIFSFQKVEGKMFSPLAYTLGYALLGSLILSLTFVPAMTKLMLDKNIRPKKNPISDWFNRSTYWLYEKAISFKKITLIVFGIILTVSAFKKIGRASC